MALAAEGKKDKQKILLRSGEELQFPSRAGRLRGAAQSKEPAGRAARKDCR